MYWFFESVLNFEVEKILVNLFYFCIIVVCSHDLDDKMFFGFEVVIWRGKMSVRRNFELVPGQKWRSTSSVPPNWPVPWRKSSTPHRRYQWSHRFRFPRDEARKRAEYNWRCHRTPRRGSKSKNATAVWGPCPPAGPSTPAQSSNDCPSHWAVTPFPQWSLGLSGGARSALAVHADGATRDGPLFGETGTQRACHARARRKRSSWGRHRRIWWDSPTRRTRPRGTELSEEKPRRNRQSSKQPSISVI